MNYETYYMNLTAANIEGQPTWKLLVDAKKDFGEDFAFTNYPYS